MRTTLCTVFVLILVSSTGRTCGIVRSAILKKLNVYMCSDKSHTHRKNVWRAHLGARATLNQKRLWFASFLTSSAAGGRHVEG